MKPNSLSNLIQLYELIENCTSNTILHESLFDAIVCPNSSWPNMIYNLNLELENIDQNIKHIQNSVVKKDLPSFCMLEFNKDSAPLVHQLKSLNLENRYWDYMEYDLNKPISVPSLPHFKIKQVSKHADILDWIHTIENSLMKGRKLDIDLLLDLNKNDCIEYYLGYENSVPVAGSMLFKKEDIAGVYMIGTLEKFQRKGYGSAVTLQVLQRADELNCKKAVLQATQAGEKIYTKLGFTIEGKVELFNLRLNR